MDLLWMVNRGNAPANPYRARPFALTAEAMTLPWYVSVIYCTELTKTQRLPHAKGKMATAGLAQLTPSLAVHAYQNSPMGRPRLPIMAG
jgi:hypothetical protein